MSINGRPLRDIPMREMDRSVESYRERQLARYEIEMDIAQDRDDRELEWLERFAPDWDEAA